MEEALAIIRSNEVDYLCNKCGNEYVCVNNPMLTFTESEDKFEVITPDKSYFNKVYKYQGRKVRLLPAFYPNGWMALLLVEIRDEDNDYVLTVNLVEDKAFGLPSVAYIDTNNHPKALEFLEANNLVKKTGQFRRSGFVEYPTVILNLPLIFQHNPDSFKEANI